MENQDLIVVHTTDKLYKAELIVGLLAEHDITANILNKKDSSYLFGEVEIYVQSKDFEAAKSIIDHRKE